MQRPAHQLLPINVNRNSRFSVRVFGVSAAGDLRQTLSGWRDELYESVFALLCAFAFCLPPRSASAHNRTFCPPFCTYMHLYALGSACMHKNEKVRTTA